MTLWGAGCATRKAIAVHEAGHLFSSLAQPPAPELKAVWIARTGGQKWEGTLRHSTITDLVSAGLPLLTIAQISGTSAEMIERHYGHLASDAAVKALGELAL